MEPLTIVTIPTPSLREPSKPLSVAEIQTADFQQFLDRLIEAMFTHDGVGIAASQVGHNIQAIIVNPSGDAPEAYINPRIIKASSTMIESEEGCLSVPNITGIVLRHKKITVEALNRHGRRVELELKQFPAIVFQHEIDHINGILFIDKALKTVKTHET